MPSKERPKFIKNHKDFFNIVSKNTKNIIKSFKKPQFLDILKQYLKMDRSQKIECVKKRLKTTKKTSKT